MESGPHPHEHEPAPVDQDRLHESADEDAKPANHGNDDSPSGGGVHMSYLRFGAMIATSTVVMFVLMYLNTYAWDHVRWSETRVYMAILMGATMALIMLGYMLSMYKNTMLNIGIAVAAVLVFGGSLWPVRRPETVQDPPHLRAQIDDVRVCRLAVEIIEAQRREIAEMDWLIADIDENGYAETAADAEERPVPDFTGTSIRTCG